MLFDALINDQGYHQNRVGNSLPSYITAIQELGFDAPVLFAAGLSVDSSRKTVEYSGSRYFAKPSAVPFTTTATFNPAQWQMFDQSFAGAEIAQVGTYSLLRAYAGAASFVQVAGRLNNQDGASYIFAVDSADTTTPDNDYDVIVDASNRRWKMQPEVAPNVTAAGADKTGVADSLPAFNKAKNRGLVYLIKQGAYKIASAFDSGSTPIVAFGADLNLLVPATTYIRSFIDLGKKAITRITSRDSSEYTGTPTSYTHLKDLTSFNIKHVNGAGYQQNFNTDAGGRTSVPAIYIEGDHIGYGDMPGTSAHIGVSRHPSWSLISGSWAGANSGVCNDGSVSANTPNVNLYGAEYHLTDKGNDRVAANGIVIAFNRTNGNPSIGAPYNTTWTAFRTADIGSFAYDGAFSINGKCHVGIDFAGATLSSKCAVALKAEDRIYFGVPALPAGQWNTDHTSLPNNYLTLDPSGGNKLAFVVGGVAALQISSAQVTANVPVRMNNSFYIPSSGNIASSATAGTNGALPAQVSTYLKIAIDGVTYKIPLYNN